MASNPQQPYFTAQSQVPVYYGTSQTSTVFGGHGDAVFTQQPIYSYQPYQTYPLAAPQSTVFVYDETATMRRNRADAVESGMLAALCASCMCCWILPPWPLWHMH